MHAFEYPRRTELENIDEARGLRQSQLFRQRLGVEPHRLQVETLLHRAALDVGQLLG